MTEQDTQTQEPPVAPLLDAGAETDTSKRPVGRPSNAQLDARQAELDQRAAELEEREAELLRRKQEVELDAAEANLAFREAELEAALSRQGTVRAQTIRSETIRQEPARTAIRERKFKGQDMPSKFDVARSDIPAGMTYQWNNHTIFGQEQHAYAAFMSQQGWEPVPASRHPHLMPPGYEGPIIVDGLVLMERPAELTAEALQEGLDRARGEVRMKEEQLGAAPQGTLPRQRANGSNEFISVGKTVEVGTPATPNYQYEIPGAGGGLIE